MVTLGTELNLRVADPELVSISRWQTGGLVTFPARPGKVTKRRPPLASRANAFPVLLDEFGVCGTRSKNEKTHKGCELRQVLDHVTELACVTRRLTRGPVSEQRHDANNGVIAGFRISI